MLTVRIQVIDGTRTFTLLDSQPCRLLILPSCYSSYGALNFYPAGTFTHCSCQPSLDAHFSGRILTGVGTIQPAMTCSHPSGNVSRHAPGRWFLSATIYSRFIRYRTDRK